MSAERWRGESPIFTKTYDLLLWLTGRVSQFPKQHRFRLARRIEDAAYSNDPSNSNDNIGFRCARSISIGKLSSASAGPECRPPTGGGPCPRE